MLRDRKRGKTERVQNWEPTALGLGLLTNLTSIHFPKLLSKVKVHQSSAPELPKDPLSDTETLAIPYPSRISQTHNCDITCSYLFLLRILSYTWMMLFGKWGVSFFTHKIECALMLTLRRKLLTAPNGVKSGSVQDSPMLLQFKYLISARSPRWVLQRRLRRVFTAPPQAVVEEMLNNHGWPPRPSPESEGLGNWNFYQLAESDDKTQ